MSVAEIKQQIGKLTDAEREEVEIYIRQIRRWSTPEGLAELARRNREMDDGKKYTEEDLEALHQRLIAEGR